jgi:outer membrane receptor for ferrienterochelin and colicin
MRLTGVARVSPLSTAQVMVRIAVGSGLRQPENPESLVVDSSSKLGWLMSVYLQDEWKLTNKLTLNLGIRFDQMYQYVDGQPIQPARQPRL